MQSLPTGGATAASLILLTLAGAPAASAQDPAQDPAQRQLERQERSTDRTDSGDPISPELARAYRELHDAALSALERGARQWDEGAPSAPRSVPSRDTGDAQPGQTGRDRGAASAPRAGSLRGDELLIAACEEGLLAGAPVGPTIGDPAARPRGEDSKQSKQSETDARDPRDATRPSAERDAEQGQTAGLLLVCANPGSSSALRRAVAREGASASTDGRPQEASAAHSKLRPGVFLVKHDGPSVWLVDEEGRVALRTTMDDPDASRSLRARALEREASERDRAEERGGAAREQDSGDAPAEGVSALRRYSGDPNWEHVFGAITKEAMTEMGWAQRGRTTSGQ